MTINIRFLNCAYRSSLSSRLLRAGTRSATRLGSAYLNGRRLARHRVRRGGPGNCDLVACVGGCVWSVIHPNDKRQRQLLDQPTGLVTDAISEPLMRLSAVMCGGAHVAIDVGALLQPSGEHRARVVDDAGEPDLPIDPLDALHRIESRVDPGRQRGANHRVHRRQPAL